MIFPHEMAPSLPDEPHFQRVWQHYREHIFGARFTAAVEGGQISDEDVSRFQQFVGGTGQPTFGIFILAKSGKLAHLERDEGYQATLRVMEAMGLNDIEFDSTTAMPVDEQFWQQFDGCYQLTEAGMRADLPYFITDPANMARVQALLESGDDNATGLPAEETRQLA